MSQTTSNTTSKSAARPTASAVAATQRTAAGSTASAKGSPSKPAPPVKKIYAIYGLLEYQARIPAGATSFKVEFSGGQITGYGVRPATYATTDPVVQRWIERSPDFRRGRIVELQSGY